MNRSLNTNSNLCLRVFAYMYLAKTTTTEHLLNMFPEYNYLKYRLNVHCKLFDVRKTMILFRIRSIHQFLSNYNVYSN